MNQSEQTAPAGVIQLYRSCAEAVDDVGTDGSSAKYTNPVRGGILDSGIYNTHVLDSGIGYTEEESCFRITCIHVDIQIRDNVTLSVKDSAIGRCVMLCNGSEILHTTHVDVVN